jgi:hypothetical protein
MDPKGVDALVRGSFGAPDAGGRLGCAQGAIRARGGASAEERRSGRRERSALRGAMCKRRPRLVHGFAFDSIIGGARERATRGARAKAGRGQGAFAHPPRLAVAQHEVRHHSHRRAGASRTRGGRASPSSRSVDRWIRLAAARKTAAGLSRAVRGSFTRGCARVSCLAAEFVERRCDSKKRGRPWSSLRTGI